MTLKSDRAMVVLSGGQDSTTCLFWAIRAYGKENVGAVTFDYGQAHRIEIEAASRVADMADVAQRHEIIRVPDVLVSTSPLTNGGAGLERYDDYNQMEQVIGNRVEKTFVPLRNPFFLTLAANRAVAVGAGRLVTGICQADNANYPDCRDDFRVAMEFMLNHALGLVGVERVGGIPLKVEAPLMWLPKDETVRLARTLPGCWEALAYSHTSYDGRYPPTDMNHANVLRAKGFEDAGFPDPLVERAWRAGLMSLPTTANYDVLRREEDGL